MKIIYSGLESSGKSLKLAMVTIDLVHRNAKWFKKSGKTRPLVSNMYFTKEFFDYSTKEMGIPIIYWENLSDLEKHSNCDVIMDEVGNYYDSRLWETLSLDSRRWLTQGAKLGVEIYGSAQDFAQVDKAFRRLVNNLVHITKLIGSRRPCNTKPPVNRIWGICASKELNPMGYDEDKSKFKPISIFPSFFSIKRSHCEIFDTTQKIKRSELSPYKHIVRECEIPNCVHLAKHRRVLHI